VVRDELLEKHPGLATDVFNAFAESKRLYIEKLRAGTLEKMTPADETYKRVMQVTGKDPLPYGIEPNRAVLDNLIASALEQGILKRPVMTESLFARETLGLTG
jgi:4,5-dihydroxyphthalate decarboxylase